VEREGRPNGSAHNQKEKGEGKDIANMKLTTKKKKRNRRKTPPPPSKTNEKTSSYCKQEKKRKFPKSIQKGKEKARPAIVINQWPIPEKKEGMALHIE